MTHVGRRTAVALSGPTRDAPTFAWTIDTESERVHRIHPPKDTVNLLVTGKDDRILAITSRGELYRAETPGSAREASGFVRLGAQEGIELWDATPTHVVGSSGAEVVVSSDGGKSFRRHMVLAGGRITALVAREDGVILATVEHENDGGLFVSRGGARWQSASAPVDGLRRAGRWVFGEVSGCTVVLAAGSTTWMLGEETVAPEPARALVVSESGGGYERRSGAARLFTMDAPPAPALDPKRALPRASAHWPTCDGKMRMPANGRKASARNRVDETETLQVRQLGGVLTSSRRLALLRNGRCSKRANERGDCDEGSLSEPPQAIRYAGAAEGTETLELPKGCTNAWTENFGGLGVVACWEGDASDRIFVIGTEPRFVEERPPLPLPLRRGGDWWSQGTDGSLLFRSACVDGHAATCPWLVRRPVEPGSPGAFWVFTANDASALRVIDSEHVLVVQRLGARPAAHRGPQMSMVRLSVYSPDGARTIAEQVTLPEVVRGVSVEGGHVVFGGQDEEWVLRQDGTVAPL